MSNPTIGLLKAHRSIRSFENRPLDDGMLETLIECGQCASTSSNMQTYSIIQVADEKRKAQLAKLCADQKQIHECAAFLVFCADLYRDHMANSMHDGERFDGDYAEALLIATVDVALVMQNVSVAAESMGLGICMIGAMRNEPKAVGALLGLPPFVFAVAGLCIGYPSIDPACKPRLPLKAVLHTEHYLDDETHQGYMTDYDETMTAFYQSQNMHDRDPRWTHVMAGRTGRFHDRVELDGFLKGQGFGMQVSEEKE